MTKIVAVPRTFPYGQQKITRLAPSTGPYGKHVGGTPPINAVKVRKGRG